MAIVCQGGGSHASFTAGVLSGLLADFPADYRVVGLGGTSGGAVCAVAAWYGKVAETTDPETVLKDLWDDIAANAAWEQWVNELTLMTAQAPSMYTPKGTSPYNTPGTEWGRQQLEGKLTDHIDFETIEELGGDQNTPDLLISAVDVLEGEPVVFQNEAITAEAVVASAAIPQLFEAIEIDGSYHWDGFLSQNPPIRDFITDDSIPPIDELWVIQLTPASVNHLPKTIDEIDERTQKLVENLSLSHELTFVETVNDWVASGVLSDPSITETTIRSIELQREHADTSRLNRRKTFISERYADGQAKANNFLHTLEGD